jgi:hypothetical protein
VLAKLHGCSCPVPRRLLPYCLNSVPCGKFVVNALAITNRYNPGHFPGFATKMGVLHRKISPAALQRAMQAEITGIFTAPLRNGG